MPRCQRTFRKLPAGVALPSGVGAMRWTCPHCPDHETYETVNNAKLLRYAELALRQAICDFGPPLDVKRPTLILIGQHPECVREDDDKRYEIYLQTHSDAFQLCLQIGHEIFHRVCSQGRIFHWTHEMLACVFSVRLLHQQNNDAYAQKMDVHYREQAALLSVADLQAAPLHAGMSGYLPGLYGRAYVTGRELEAVVGWPALCKLARCDQNTPAHSVPVSDIKGWIKMLPPAQKYDVGMILGITGV